MLFAVLAFGAIVLTYALFSSKSSMLGFPCTIFWAILGGYCYQQSTVTWDIYYLTFFASFGLAIFSAFAAFALRTKKEEATEGDSYFDEGGDDDVKFIDEGGNEKGKGDSNTKNAVAEPDSEKPSQRIRGIRDRASKRRSRLE